MSQLKRTPLYPIYEKYHGKIIDFGGWALPVQFTSIKEEHETVRTKVGLFDVSHMGEIEVTGKDSLSFLQKLCTNDLAKLTAGKAMYTAMCNENGGSIDDLIVYKKQDDHFLLVVNAANTDNDYQWLRKHLFGEVFVHNISHDVAQLALQGPLAIRVLQKLTAMNISDIAPFSFQDHVLLQGKSALVSRTGYTGEDGFEIYLAAADAVDMWEDIMAAGAEFGIKAIGLGARDTLRFEATLPLYGQELTSDISPLEAGIGFAVKLSKAADFIGKAALEEQKEAGLARKLVGIAMIEKGIPRTGYDIFHGEERIGHVTTGTQSPTLKKNIGLALIDHSFSNIGTELDVVIRGKRKKAVVVTTPFYRRKRGE